MVMVSKAQLAARLRFHSTKSIPPSLHIPNAAMRSCKPTTRERKGNWRFHNTFSAVGLKDSSEEQVHKKLT